MERRGWAETPSPSGVSGRYRNPKRPGRPEPSREAAAFRAYWTAMLYGVAADLLVVVHLAFVVFVVLGGFAAPRWPRLAWIHLPAVAWGVGIELTGAICPLTPLEQWLRIEAGAAGYEGDFIAHYLLPVLYPAGLTRQAQLALGAVACGINAAAYGWWGYRAVVLRRGADAAPRR